MGMRDARTRQSAEKSNSVPTRAGLIRTTLLPSIFSCNLGGNFVHFLRYAKDMCEPIFSLARSQRASKVDIGASLQLCSKTPRMASPCNSVNLGGTASPTMRLMTCSSRGHASSLVQRNELGIVCKWQHSKTLRTRFSKGWIVVALPSVPFAVVTTGAGRSGAIRR